jgi:GNAT superfamily N-acetyltransferase
MPLVIEALTGHAAGLMTFRPWGGNRPGVLRPTVHLRHGFTAEEARAAGIGAALLDRAMLWAH